jgi:hypothetical protein
MIRELNVYAAADGVLTVSQKEADLLTDLIGDPTLAHVVPLAEDLLPSPIPLEQRKGVLFLGNFRHSPNVDAVDYLCNEILPLIDPTLLVEHPVSIVGNALNDSVRSYGRHLDHVNMIGWVPSVLPYLHRTRVMAVPLRYGAGTKGKIVQSLMAGTPTVSTTIGIEGLHLRDGQEVLVADDPRTFASGISRLLRDERLCELLSRQGREHMTARHGRDVVRQRLLDAITMVLVKPARRGAPLAPSQVSDVVGQEQYREMVARVRHAVAEVVPEGATIAVTSRGDEELLKIPARRGWHFPQDDRGIYAGHYPRDGAAAVEHLEALRKKGAGFLVFPETARWWLNHYDELKRHLELYSRQVLRREGDCIIFDLREPVQPVPATVLRSAAECSTRGE